MYIVNTGHSKIGRFRMLDEPASWTDHGVNQLIKDPIQAYLSERIPAFSSCFKRWIIYY